jgi:hypothetical protein
MRATLWMLVVAACAGGQATPLESDGPAAECPPSVVMPQPAPAKPGVRQRMRSHVTGLSTDGVGVFGSDRQGEILRLTADTPEGDSVTKAQGTTYLTATDAVHVYWTGNGLWRAPKTGGPPERLSDEHPYRMIAHGGSIFISHVKGKWARVDPDHTQVALTNVGEVTTDGRSLYFAYGRRICRIAQGRQGPCTTLAAEPWQLVAAHGVVVAVTWEGIWVIDSIGRPARQVATRDRCFVRAIHASAQYVVWKESCDGLEELVRRVPLAGGDVATIDLPIDEFVLVGETIVWTSEGRTFAEPIVGP